MATPIWKGLTHDQMSRVRLAVRYDTYVTDGGGFPATNSNVGEPFDGDTVKIWTDASRGHAYLNMQGDSPSYDANAGGLTIKPGDEFRVIESDMRGFNNLYFECVRTDQFAMAIKLDFLSTPSSGNFIPIMGNAVDSTEVGWRLDAYTDGSGNEGLRFRAMNGSSYLWDSGQVDYFLSGSGYDTIFLAGAESSNYVEMRVNGSIIWSDSSANFMSTGTPASNYLAIGTIDGGGGDLDAIMRGLLIDSIGGATALDQEEWIEGNDYEANP